VVTEHNIDVVRVSDWVIELGPKGGHGGGVLVGEGTPEDIAALDTATAPFVKAALLQHSDRRQSDETEPANSAPVKSKSKKPAAKVPVAKKP
jgi:excinuclease ABC subunit A